MVGKRINTKIVILILVSLLIISCSKNKVENITSTDKEDNKTEEKIILTYYAPSDSHSESSTYYVNVLRDFDEKNKNISIIYDGIPTADGYNQFLLERLEAGVGDDLYVANADSVKALASGDYLYDMSKVPYYDMLPEATKAQTRFGGISYCIPLSMTSYALIVNLDVLNSYSLKVPESIEEFYKTCEVLKANGVTPIGLNRWYALTVPAMITGLYDIYSSPNKDEIIAKLNSGEEEIGSYMEKGFQTVKDFIDNGWYGDNLTTKEVDRLRAGKKEVEDLANNRVAFCFAPLNCIELAHQVNPNANIIIAGLPTYNGTLSMPTFTIRLCINKDGDHIEESVALADHIGRNFKDRPGIELEFKSFANPDYKPSRELEMFYNTYFNGKYIPLEDLDLKFNYWDVIREYTIDMFDGSTVLDAVNRYNEYQKSMISE